MDSIFVRKSYLGPGKGWKAVKAMTAAERKGALEHARLTKDMRKRYPKKKQSGLVQDSTKDVVARQDAKDAMAANRSFLHSKSRDIGNGRRVMDSDRVTPGSSFVGRYGLSLIHI